MINDELKRIKIEKYNFTKNGKLRIIPLIILILVSIFLLYNAYLFKADNKEISDLVIQIFYFIFLPLVFIEFIYNDIVDSWESKYYLKIKLIDSVKYNLDDYILDNIYTDNKSLYIYSYFIKFIYWIINIIFLILLIKWFFGLLFGLGFTIVTLIITILLLIIIYLLINKK